MAELIAQVADRIDRAVQRVTLLPIALQRKGRRWMRRAMRKPGRIEGRICCPVDPGAGQFFRKRMAFCWTKRSTPALASCVTIIQKRFYSELRSCFAGPLRAAGLTAMAQKLSVQLSADRKIMLGCSSTI